jgi:hypothetical protein
MEYTIHALHLHRDITLPENGPAPDGTTKLYAYRSLVAKNDLEPTKADHLAGRTPVREIGAGQYLFTQGPLPDEKEEEAFRDAAEAIWLEALWQEAELADDKVYVRILAEDSKTVFQVFRRATRKQNA